MKGKTEEDVPAALAERLGRDEGGELDRALAEVERIALLGLKHRLPPRDWAA